MRRMRRAGPGRTDRADRTGRADRAGRTAAPGRTEGLREPAQGLRKLARNARLRTNEAGGAVDSCPTASLLGPGGFSLIPSLRFASLVLHCISQSS